MCSDPLCHYLRPFSTLHHSCLNYPSVSQIKPSSFSPQGLKAYYYSIFTSCGSYSFFGSHPKHHFCGKFFPVSSPPLHTHSHIAFFTLPSQCIMIHIHMHIYMYLYNVSVFLSTVCLAYSRCYISLLKE